uniref:Genome polyprotein n=1 Tax=Crocidura tanakae iflavirus 2 TaxID=3139553 RepID=A0AB38ZK74_9VIRU
MNFLNKLTSSAKMSLSASNLQMFEKVFEATPAFELHPVQNHMLGASVVEAILELCGKVAKGTRNKELIRLAQRLTTLCNEFKVLALEYSHSKLTTNWSSASKVFLIKQDAVILKKHILSVYSKLLSVSEFNAFCHNDYDVLYIEDDDDSVEEIAVDVEDYFPSNYIKPTIDDVITPEILELCKQIKSEPNFTKFKKRLPLIEEKYVKILHLFYVSRMKQHARFRELVDVLKDTEIPIRMIMTYNYISVIAEKLIFDALGFNDPIDYPDVEDLPLIEAQMDSNSCEGPVGDGLVKVEQTSNVILTTHAEEPKSKLVSIPTDNWEKLCCGNNAYVYKELMERWLRVPLAKNESQWKSTQIPNTKIFELNLPLDFINKTLKSPNSLLLESFAYFKTDIEIKLTTNSNKFNNGQLQLSWYYGSKGDKYYVDRQNIYSGSTMLSSIVDGGCSNDVLLIIPYRYYKPFLGTNKRNDDQNPLNMGSLRLYVLNSLSSAGLTTPIVDISLFLKFSNSKLAGMKYRAEMMGLKGIVNTAASMLDQIYPDEQRDNPPDVIPAKPMVPWSAHSMSIGDICPEPINSLRLQATGQTPHPPGSLPKEKECELNYIASQYGLVQQTAWNTWQGEGEVLFCIPFSPLWAMQNYYSRVFKRTEEATGYYLPPVSVISKFFSYWRGSMEYRFDFVSTQFHTGRLIIAFVPRNSRVRNMSVDKLTHCDHVVFDLREQKQFVYIQNYINDKPWHSTDLNTDLATESHPPGHIYVVVMNELTCPTSVSNSIGINLYMRGGSDFEIAVPRNPMIGHVYNTNKSATFVNTVKPLVLYGPPKEPIGINVWRQLDELKVIFRYGDGSDHITQFDTTNFQSRTVYKVVAEDVNILKYASVSILYLCRFDMDGYVYGVPFRTAESALAYASKITIADQKQAMMSVGVSPDDIPAPSCGIYNSGANVRWELYVQKISAQIGDDNVLDGAVPSTSTSTKPLTTGRGRYTFGERFTDIRQLCRRYNFCCAGTTVASGLNRQNLLIADFCFPILPLGVDVSPNNKFYYDQMIRDSPISLLSSGYRFYRGSMRYKIVLVAQAGHDVSLWIQHRPNETPFIDGQLQFKILGSTVTTVDSADSVLHSNEAMLYQMTSVNNVVEFEVPFYNSGIFGLLQYPDKDAVLDSSHYSLGRVYGGLAYMTRGGDATDIVNVNVFSSIADDMSFSVFQGFPPLMDLSEFSVKTKKAVDVDDEFDIVESNGLGDWWEQKSKSIKDNYLKKALLDEAKTLSEVVIDETESTDSTSDLTKLFSRLIDSSDIKDPQKIFNILSHVVHACISFNWKTIIWSVVSILVNMGVMCYKFMSKIKTLLEKWWKKRFGPNETEVGPKVESNMGYPSAPLDNSLDAAIASTCIAGLISVLGATSKPMPKHLPDFAQYLSVGTQNMTKNANGLFVFFKNTMEMFKRMYNWLIAYFWPDTTLAMELSDAQEDVTKLVYRMQWLLDPCNKDAVMNDPKVTVEVYECATAADAILAKVAVSEVPTPKPALMGILNGIRKLRETLCAVQKAPPVRFEPFIVSFVGPSNVGKSHLVHRIGEQFLKRINYRSYTEQMYTKTPGNAYWNALANQPLVLFDDFCCLVDQTFGMAQVCELFSLKSKAVFNPPMAAVEDKNVRYNPLAVFLASNTPYPKLDGIADETAFWRRRDVMIEVDKRAIFRNVNPRKIDKKISKNYGHLMFRFYVDPSRRESEVGEWMTYSEMLPLLLSKWGEYYEEELDQYQAALKRVRQFYPDECASTLNNLEQLSKKILAFANSRDTYEEGEIPTSKANKVLKDTARLGTPASMIAKYKAEMLKVKSQLIKATESVEAKNKVESQSKMEYNEDSLSELDKKWPGQLSTLENVYNNVNVSKVAKKNIVPSSVNTTQQNNVVTTDHIKQVLENISIEQEIYEQIILENSKKDPDEILSTADEVINDPSYSAAILVHKALMATQGDQPLEPIVVHSKQWNDNSIESDIRYHQYLVTSHEFPQNLVIFFPCVRKNVSLFPILHNSKHASIYRKRQDLIAQLKTPVVQNMGTICPCADYVNSVTLYFVVDSLPDNWKESLEDDYKPDMVGAYELDSGNYWSGLGCGLPDCQIGNPRKRNGLLSQLSAKVRRTKSSEIPANILIYRTGETVSGDATQVAKELSSNNSQSWTDWIKSKIPLTWTTLFKSIAVLTMLVGAVYTVITFVYGLMEVKPTHDATMKKIQYENMYYTNNCEMEDQFSKVLAKQLVDLNSNGVEAESYSKGTVGSKSTKAMLGKTFQNLSEEQYIGITNIVFRNTFFVVQNYFKNGEMCSQYARCLGLIGRYFIALDHYVTTFNLKGESTYYYVGTDGMQKNLEFNNIKWKKLHNSAIIVGELPIVFQSFKNLIPKISTQKQSQNLPSDCYLMTVNYNPNTSKFISEVEKFAKFTSQQQVVVCNDDGSETSVNQVYKYSKGGKGLCGSVLVTTSNTSSPIIGIHIAGVKQIVGFSEAIIQESFYPLINECSKTDSPVDKVLANLGDLELSKIHIEANIGKLGVVPSKLSQKLPLKSNIIPSLCAGEITDITYDVPVISSKDERVKDNPYSPLVAGIEHHGGIPKDFEPVILKSAYEDLNNLILSKVKSVRLGTGLLSIKTAIDGIEGISGFESMEMSTSEGFPFSSQRPSTSSDKSWLFNRSETENGFVTQSINEELTDLICKEDKMRRNKVIPNTVFVDCLKDCKMPKEKCCVPGKVRIFSVSPVQFTIALRRYFLDFCAAYQNSRIEAEHAIGIDISSMEAHNLITHLLSFSPHFVTGDYSKFGPTLMSSCVYYAVKIIRNWYMSLGSTPEEDNVRMIMGEELRFANHLSINMIYTVLCGAPSGSPITTIINSLVNCLYVRVAWGSIMRKYDPTITVSSFSTYCQLIVYGDDLIMTVKKEFIEWFNNDTISEFFSQYDIKFTDATKSAKSDKKWYSINDPQTSFLKHTFHMHDIYSQFWCAKLDARAALETCNWIWKSNKQYMESTKEACLATLESLSGHGGNTYSMYRDKIATWFQDHGEYVVLPTYDEIVCRKYNII